MRSVSSSDSKAKLLENLRYRTFCRLGTSKLSGIGVIAIKKIPRNVDPFQTVYRLETVSIELSPKEVESLDPGVSTLVKDFFMRTPNNMYPVYFNGLNALDIAYYLNHSENPNVMMVNEINDVHGVHGVHGVHEVHGVLSNLISERDQFDLMQTSYVDQEKDTENIPSEYYTFKTIRPIGVGEELTINYYQHATSLDEVKAIKKQFQLP